MTAPPDLGATGLAALARHTTDTEIRGTRRIVARTVASEPLDHYAASGALSEREYEAGKRLRGHLTGSWPAQRCTAPAAYASDGSDYDDDDAAQTDDERWAVQSEHYAAWRAAEKLIRRDWPTVRGVCSGYWLGALGDAAGLKRGLRVLADEWGY